MPKKKTWLEKLHEKKEPQIKSLDNDFADMQAGSKMLIATPQIIENYINSITLGKLVNTKTLRQDLAIEYNAHYTCPVTTGIFLRIIAEANYERLQQGEPLENITPFWRVIEPNSALAKKLSFGQDFIIQQLQVERI